MKVVRAPVSTSIPQKKTWMLEGFRTYVDPNSLGTNISNRLDVLLLLADKIFVSEPTLINLKKWKYNEVRFTSLVQERFFIPIYVHQEPSLVYGGENFLLRKDIIEDIEFNSIYDRCIEDDMNDSMFVSFSKRSSSSQRIN